MIKVEVAYATPDKQIIIPVKVMPNATAEEAIIASGILRQFSEIDLSVVKIGVFSKSVTLETRLRDQDRVEIYRPLLIDPKLARKNRAKQAKE